MCGWRKADNITARKWGILYIVGTSYMSINHHMSVAMQRLVDFISMVTQQYVTKQ
jgi:hypothetical protein